MRWFAVLVAALVLLAVASADGEIWEEDDHEILIRSERGAKNRGKQACKYSKGAWSDCDSTTNMRSRTLTLRKGDPASCEKTKTIQKKCKKACRYEKGSWSECNGQGDMTRTDKIKANSDPYCEQSREISKKCKTKKGPKPTKGGRRNRN